MEERGVNVDHATLNRWVIRYAPAIAAKAHSQKRNTNRSILRKKERGKEL
jgi:putative transposase